MVARYAIYYAPAANSRWWQFGCRWLGRDAISGEVLPQFEMPGMPAEALHEITAEPRRYGFHATLKPPFALADGTDPHELYQIVEALAAEQRPFALGALTLQSLGSFLALAPKPEPVELTLLAATCVEQLDLFRSVPTEEELARRRAAGLSPRQNALLLRWGYPHVMDHWRFHMTLTGRLTESKREALAPWLEHRVRELRREPLTVDALCVFEQASPEAAFRLVRRFGFAAAGGRRKASGRRGRLIYVVGASGAGKDSLIDYARARVNGHPVTFARRCITRDAAAGGEDHLALSTDEFDASAARGEFALQWHTNGHCYGIGAEIDRWMDAGLDVVVNGSRGHLPSARARYPEMTTVWVSASAATLRVRLARRGREDDAAIEQRLARAAFYSPPPDAVVIANDGALEHAGERLLRVLVGDVGSSAQPVGGCDPISRT